MSYLISIVGKNLNGMHQYHIAYNVKGLIQAKRFIRVQKEILLRRFDYVNAIVQRRSRAGREKYTPHVYKYKRCRKPSSNTPMVKNRAKQFKGRRFNRI